MDNFLTPMKRRFASLSLWGLVVFGLCSPIAIAQTKQSNNGNTSITVLSDIQEANSETGIITAKGNVRIYYPDRQIQATAAEAQYLSKERQLILRGNVYVLQESNSIKAENITYLIDEGRFIATPTSSSQVESVYIVPPEENTP
jgi:lipopolysaccharide export system protein LptA